MSEDQAELRKLVTSPPSGKTREGKKYALLCSLLCVDVTTTP